MNCIIGGTSLLHSKIFSGWDEEVIKTPYGKISVRIDKKNIFLQRHGFLHHLPPHKINHRANIWALKNLNVQKMLSINSVGSLKIKLKPGTLIIPHDFISPWNIVTFFDNEMRFTVPEMNKILQKYIYKVCKEIKIPVYPGGVYIQTIGPRLETRAEINMLKKFGDVIGMTLASEATLCMEYNIPYASICSIDNYCNGVIKRPLTMNEIEKNIKININKIETIIQVILSRAFS